MSKNLQPRGKQVAGAFPPKLARPAQRALANAGYTRLEQLSQVTEMEIAKLHGMGPKAIEQLRAALAAIGKAFAKANSSASDPSKSERAT